MSKYVVIFKGKEDENIITSVGGVVTDSVDALDNFLIAELTDEAASMLLNHPDIEVLEKEYSVKGDTSDVEDGAYDYTYGYCEAYYALPLKLRDYWTRGIKGVGVKVGVMDTGIYPNKILPALKGGYTHKSTLPYNQDMNGHGTHVAGIIAGKHDNTGSFRGVSPNVELYSIRVDKGDSTKDMLSSAIVSGFNYAISNKLDILNCSLSTDGGATSSISIAAQKAIDAGILVVCASSNNGENSSRYPGRLDDAISVINVQPDFTLRNDSNYGVGCDLAVYGTWIPSAKNAPTGIVVKSGTSMAAPVVAGIAALYKQLLPTLTNKQLKAKLIQNGTNKTWSEKFAYGAPMPPNELYSKVINSPMPKQAHYSKNGNLVPARFYVNKGSESAPKFVATKCKVKTASGIVEV